MNRLIMFLICLAVGASFSRTAMAAGSDGTGWRARLSAVDNSAFTDEDTGDEVLFGREVAARVLGQYKLTGNARVQKYVNLVGSSLAQYSSRPELVFHFAVIDSDEINAYSTPGGYVFVTSAALSLMANEAELAGVLAHEIAHVTERHIVRELNLRAAEKSPVSSIAALIGGSTESAGVAFTQAVDRAVDIIFRDGYKKEDEMQADGDAVLLCTFAGYDPAGLITFLDKVSQVKGAVGKTYPVYDVRLATIQKTMAEEGIVGLQLSLNGARFAAMIGK